MGSSTTRYIRFGQVLRRQAVSIQSLALGL